VTFSDKINALIIWI